MATGLRFLYRYNADMRQSLRVHPDSPCFAVTHIEAEVTRPGADSLVFYYFVNGRIIDLHMPAPVPAARTDDLWRHTCFEAFVRTSDGAAYYEFNFTPSRQWAAYGFSSYRSGMRVATEIIAPRIELQSSPTCYRLQASLELDLMLSPPGDEVWRIGLAAVIEEKSGHKSYWALAHPTGKADFHHSDGFALEFPKVQQP
jgi:hypothetical protein